MPRYQKVLLLTGGIVSALLSLIVLVLNLIPEHSPATRRKIERHVQSLKQKGIPVTAGDLARVYPDPERSQNAELLLTNCYRLLVKPKPMARILFMGADVPKGTNRIPAEVQADTREFLMANRAALEAFPAAWPSGTRFPNGWNGGFTNLNFVDLVAFRQLVLTLAASACFEAEERHTEQSVEAVMKEIRLLEAVPSTFLVTHMIKRAGQGAMAQSVERLLNVCDLTEEQLLGIQGKLSSGEERGMEKAFATERCQGIGFFETLIQAEDHAGVHLKADIALFHRLRRLVHLDPPVITLEDVVLYLESMDKLLSVFPLALEERVLFLRTNHIRADLEKGSHSLFLRLVLPNWEQVLSKDIKVLTQLRVLEAALAIERYRLKNQKMPEDLKELVPQFVAVAPKDPYTGNMLRFKKMEIGYMVWSVGPNGNDEAGRSDAPQVEKEIDDIVIRIQR
jgi:hypothetical protein